MENFNIIKAERKQLEYVDDISVEAYLMPDGTYRIGLMSAAIALGYGRDWLSQVFRRGGKTLQALQGLGFTGSSLQVELPSIKGGGVKAKTISLADWQRLKIYAAQQGKENAVKLLAFQSTSSDLDILSDLFNQQRLSLQEKRDFFYKEFALTFDWAAEDKEDWEVIEEAIAFQSIPVLINW